MSLEKKHSKLYGPLLMVGSSICFAGGGAAIKFIPWNALAINGARNLIAALVFFIYMRITRHKLVVNPTVLLGSLCMVGVTSLFVVANKLTTAGNAIILQYTCPIWIALFLIVFFHERPSGLQILTIVLVLCGIGCFFYDSISGSGGMLGNIAAVFSGIFYAMLFLLNKFEKGDAISSLFLGQIISGIVFMPLIVRESDHSLSTLLALVFLGAVQVGLAYLCFAEGTKYTNAITASLINGIEPILNPVIVAFMFHEVLTPISLVGAFVVLSSVLIYNILMAAKQQK